jgi:hypothetical protein
MKLPRRQFLHLAVGAAALPTVSRVAKAQTYPTRARNVSTTLRQSKFEFKLECLGFSAVD